MMTTQTRAADLTPGTRVQMHPTLNSCGFVGTVVSVEPWILTAGPHAGQQATSGRRQGQGEPLLSVRIEDVTVTEPSLREPDLQVDSPVRLMSMTATDTLTVED